MKKITFILVLLLTTLTFAQQGINYKAVIKDGGGNVIASTAITVQFTIYEGAGETTIAYQETHTPTTDSNGIIILNIGEGSVDSGVFANIDWAADDHYLNTQIDTGGGFTDMGTTQFMAVPYALHAANVTGLEQITENGNTGHRLIGSDPANHGDIGIGAVDLSLSEVVGDHGASGDYSLASGYRSTASGLYSVALGNESTASGNYSRVLGYNSTASGIYSTVMGVSSTASGDFSTVMGVSLTASGNFSTAIGIGSETSGYYSTAMGSYNIGGGNATTWVETDPLFEIGNGTGFNARANALTVLKNGTITAPSFDIAEITDDKALITKEYADANLVASGLEKITENGNTGHRLKGSNPANYGDIGVHAVDLSYSEAVGDYGATGSHSTAIGYLVTASGYGSTAIGSNTKAESLYSTAIGINTKAESLYSTAIGLSNIGGGSPGTWVETDPLFEIGNGYPIGTSNALTILKNGRVEIPAAMDANPNSGSGVLEIANALRIDGNEIITNIAMPLYLNNDNGGDLIIDASTLVVDASMNSVGIGTTAPIYPLHVTTRNTGAGDSTPNHYLANAGVGTNGSGWTYSIGATYGVWSGVGFSTSSDSRIKNIVGQSNATEDLSKLMQLEVTDYQFIDIVNKGNDVTKKVIAQQVKEIVPNAVNYTTDFIPNVYAMASVSIIDDTSINLTLNKNPDVNVGDIIKVVPKDAAELQTKVLAIDGNSLEVSITNAQDLGDQLFVFGKQVNDFHTVDYDAISMLNVSATQAQQKLIEKLQEEIAALKIKNSLLQTEISEIDILKQEIATIKALLIPTNNTNNITQN